MTLPAHPIPDEEWCEMLASYAIDELIAGKLLSANQADFARRIIQQQAYILLFSNAYPAGDLNSD
jgi:hypothetical protein